MKGCPEVCPREEESQDEESLGVIAADETIARGAFEPSHGNPRTKNIRAALVPRMDVYAGEGSVWRVGQQGISIDDLVERLKRSRTEPLFALLAARAWEIRAITLGAEGPRAFSLVDECICDADGNKHPAHAHIALCARQKEAGLSPDSPEFIAAHRALIETLKKNWIWEAGQVSH